MTGFQGLDPLAVEQLASQLHAQARGLAAIQRQISSLVSHASTYWRGPEMRHFTDDWQRHHLRATQNSVEALEGVSRSARNNAVEQRRTSASAQGVSHRDLGGSGSSGLVGVSGPAVSHDIRPREFLELAEGSYHGPTPITVGGHTWTPVGPDELRKLGIGPGDMRDEVSGFAATLYRAEDGTYVLAYAGTKDIEGDWINNVVGASPAQLSRQTEQAVTLALTLDKTIDGDLVFTGHSLGGRLAAVASIATDRPATTFNAAGVSDTEFFYALESGGKDGHLAENVVKGTFQIATRGILGDGPDLYGDERRALEDRVTAYYGSNDVLTDFQELTSFPNAVGQQVRITSSTLHPVEAHDLADLRKRLPD